MIFAYANSLTFSITVLLFKDVHTYILRECIDMHYYHSIRLVCVEYHWMIHITMTPPQPRYRLI